MDSFVYYLDCNPKISKIFRDNFPRSEYPDLYSDCMTLADIEVIIGMNLGELCNLSVVDEPIKYIPEIESNNIESSNAESSNVEELSLSSYEEERLKRIKSNPLIMANLKDLGVGECCICLLDGVKLYGCPSCKKNIMCDGCIENYENTSNKCAYCGISLSKNILN